MVNHDCLIEDDRISRCFSMIEGNSPRKTVIDHNTNRHWRVRFLRFVG